jgi:hypothetical protein
MGGSWWSTWNNENASNYYHIALYKGIDLSDIYARNTLYLVDQCSIACKVNDGQSTGKTKCNDIGKYIVVSVCFLKCVNACEHVLHLQVISTN